ncbi:carboxypeptidase-like regulatory domain-containing protein [Mesonia aestuariivivens]|uniref:Carboxypeptidase-like regulatory domain-containing protein n=1 Tax=Mesonia aestuariivivens TaxID=2796128 RepID=A0ABS6VZB1_9FLAO|nr:carboxypeptidase-like regulatory domain-containing protein [Mesonia aestuariivivens]MBW2960922.1 carboxypeptidase-like regulatory domain-containing protein [Mesonia aestuariivivens]
MKNIVFICSLVFIAFCSTANAQIDVRSLIKGKINVDASASAADINVYNLNTTKGTVTNDYGEFFIEVEEGDELYFSGVQYQDFKVIIKKKTIDSGKINITINEAVTELDEVTVKPYGLSGDVEVDVAKINTVNTNYPDQSSIEMVRTTDYELRPDSQTEVENDAIDKSYLKNGLNFANIFRTIFNSKRDNNSEAINENIDVQIRKVYNDDFFRKYLDIDRDNINEFIYYAEEHGLKEELLTRGSELELIEFLIDKSKMYKMQQD